MKQSRICLAAALIAVFCLSHAAAAAEKMYFAVPSLNGIAQLGPYEFNFGLGYLTVYRNKDSAFGNCLVVFTAEKGDGKNLRLDHPSGGFFAVPGGGDAFNLTKPAEMSASKAASAVSEWAERNRKKVVLPGSAGANCG